MSLLAFFVKETRVWLISVTVGANAAICFYGYGTFTQLPWWFESLSEVESCRQGCPPIMTSRCFTHYSYEYPAFLLIAVLRSNAGTTNNRFPCCLPVLLTLSGSHPISERVTKGVPIGTWSLNLIYFVVICLQVFIFIMFQGPFLSPRSLT